ncbi:MULTISPECIES: hypothetical protein [unclassified Streptomyces]|uniref:hypothetical protein n=1 Tax=unclassified Streptomyces TaxID=2593676 RepID=UPI0022561603|nr:MULTISPECIES: hypothetical protein [unclassified Streptomyces]MCX4792529.1 hypothetical protein [Streptomyces sp. NBC_01221]WSP68080.1 hypothetical protein OG466_40840 [Streptomyces sp. NBC_01240]
MTISVTHDGPDQMGFPSQHKGLIENCSFPDCETRAKLADEAWGVHCPHGKRIVEKDPEAAELGHLVGRLVDPWPCTEDGCTLERFEASEQADEGEHWDSLMGEVPR